MKGLFIRLTSVSRMGRQAGMGGREAGYRGTGGGAGRGESRQKRNEYKRRPREGEHREEGKGG